MHPVARPEGCGARTHSYVCVQAAADHAVSQERRNEAQAAALQEQARQLQAAQQAWDKQHAETKGAASQAMRPQMHVVLIVWKNMIEPVS